MQKSKYPGLTTVEIIIRQEKYGKNIIQTKPKNSIWKQILNYFLNPIVIVLLGAASLSLFIGEIRNSLVISTMVLLSVCLNFLQDYRANSASDNYQKNFLDFAK
jgi:P-type Mg2+ transporter